MVDGPFGCYGLQIAGIDGARHAMIEMPAARAAIQVTQHPGFDGDREREYLAEHTSRLHLSDGTGVAELNWAARTVDLRVREAYDDEALLHPMLSSAMAISNRWLGRDSFHAGAFVLNDLSWVVIGDKGQGKSSLLGYLATVGVQVVADDLVIEESGRIFAGPAFVDLRPDAAMVLGVGRDVGVLGARPRVRLAVDIPRASYPLGGWIILGWSAELTLRRVPLAERLRMLYANRAVRRDPVDPRSYVRHGSLPFYELTRPKDWGVLPDTLDLLQTTAAIG